MHILQKLTNVFNLKPIIYTVKKQIHIHLTYSVNLNELNKQLSCTISHAETVKYADKQIFTLPLNNIMFYLTSNL